MVPKVGDFCFDYFEIMSGFPDVLNISQILRNYLTSSVLIQMRFSSISFSFITNCKMYLQKVGDFCFDYFEIMSESPDVLNI